MAVWQYQLNVIPKKSILEKYGEIPNEIFIDKMAWEKYWANLVDIENLPEPEFEDAKTINWWKNINLDVKKTSEQIDLLVNRNDWSDKDSGFIGWKGYSELDEDNDAHIVFDKKTNNILEFEFRTDLRSKENLNKFLKGILKICEQNELLVFNINGFLFEPKFEIIFEDLKKSNAVAFLTDPEKFLDKINEETKINKIKNFTLKGKVNEPKKISFWSKLESLFK